MHNPDALPHAFIKNPKRKRLAKACDACHKSKRRCDGTAPCSNCYYASKPCAYTDASGRPVPAPRSSKHDRQDPQSSASQSDPRPYPSSQYNQPHPFRMYPGPSATSQYQQDPSDEDHKQPRKRFRDTRGNPMPVDDLVIDGPVSMDRPVALDLDPQLTRELTNLFFTHCHPARAIIHKPTFAADLSHNRVPSHLLLAVCALAAPLSKQPRIRTSPARFAGKPFAQEALSQMFDGAGRLVCEPNLAAAQALCILQMHDIMITQRNAPWSSRFHELALQIVEVLGVHHPEHPTLTPVPSQEFVQNAIEREAIRRAFWLIHFLDVLASIYFKKPTTFTESELRLRLPVDETSFEMGVHSTLPEYLYLPAVRTRYASEFGHLIRIVSIYAKMESALDELNDPQSLINPENTLTEVEQKMDEWARTLPDHLRFSHDSLQVQQSMFETSSNTGAWCWCCMHVYHASCALALNLARQRTQRGMRSDLQWALETLDLILKLLGDRAKNSILMGAVLWSLVKYCKRDDPQIRHWVSVYEETSGTSVSELVQDWRGSQPSPPTIHMFPPSQQQAQQQQPPPQQTQPPPPPPPPGPQQAQSSSHSHSHAHAHAHHNHLSQHPHNRRLSDVRGPGSLTQAHPPNSAPRNQGHHDGSGSYGNAGNCNNSASGSSTVSGSNPVRRSPSQSPPSFFMARPPNSNASSGSTSVSNRTLPLGSGSLPDSGSTSGGNSTSGSNSRESRSGSHPLGTTGTGTGTGMGHCGSESGGTSLVVGGANQSQGHVGKFGGAGASRWTLEGSSSSSSGNNGSGGGGVGGEGAQNGFSGGGGGMSGPGVAGDVTLSQIGGGSGSGNNNNNNSSSASNNTGAGGVVGGGTSLNGASSSSTPSSSSNNNNGKGSSSSNNGSGQRSHALLGDGTQSLPSLKESGLLNSWASSRVGGSSEGAKQASPPSQQQQQQQQAIPRRTSPAGMMPALHSPSQHHHSADMRPPPLGLPVGLPWLASEPTR